MKRYVLSGMVALTCLAIHSPAFAQYTSQQTTLLPGYPSTQDGYASGGDQRNPTSSTGSYQQGLYGPQQTSSGNVPQAPYTSRPGLPGQNLNSTPAGHDAAAYPHPNSVLNRQFAAGLAGHSARQQGQSQQGQGQQSQGQQGQASNGQSGADSQGAGSNGPATVYSQDNRGPGVAPYQNVVGGRSVGSTLARTRSANWTIGVSGLIFERDYEDDVNLSAVDGGPYLFSTDADHNAIGGFEGVISRRGASGRGVEARYWGLFADHADVTFSGPGVYSALSGLSNLTYGASNVLTTYNVADNHRIYRDTELHNVELNFLRNAGCINGFLCRDVNVELIAGARYLRFDEFFRYGTFTSNPNYPSQLFYDSEVENELMGFQLGARTEHCVTQRLRLSVGTKFGIYNNEIYHRQSVSNGAGNYAFINNGPYNGDAYNAVCDKDDIAVLGELDLGVLYELSNCVRLSIGYRVVGVGGVALAADQVPYNFADIVEAERVNSNGNLFLHGAYAGLDFCF